MITFVMLLFFVSACSAFNNLPPIPAASPLPVSFALPDLSTAYSITIIENWSGLSNIAPMNSLYFLENLENFFDKEHFWAPPFFPWAGIRLT
jgi:hypothetical protein